MSQITAIALIVYAGAYLLLERPVPKISASGAALLIPMFAWLGVSLIAALTGIRPLHALSEVSKTAVYMLLPLALFVSLQVSCKTAPALLHRCFCYISALLTGQAIASFHTLASTALQTELQPRPPGPVTESGQLVLILPMLIALMSMNKRTHILKERIAQWALFFLIVILYLATSWHTSLPALRISSETFSLIGALILSAVSAFFIFRLVRDLRANPSMMLRFSRHTLLHIVIFALLLGALVVNLKRGPWLGASAALIFFGLYASRRTLFFTLAAVVLAVAFLEPVQIRLAQTMDHFFIHGGRQSMWQMGFELAQRFPLGLGPDNASYMRELDPTLPELHRHMHNNFINVAVESGWIGFLFFSWWMLALICIGPRALKARFQSKTHVPVAESQAAVLLLMLSASLFGWQVAGLAEYNFGDGEVRLIALFYIGLMLALLSKTEAHRTKTLASSEA